VQSAFEPAPHQLTKLVTLKTRSMQASKFTAWEPTHAELQQMQTPPFFLGLSTAAPQVASPILYDYSRKTTITILGRVTDQILCGC
jgi:hypothetical protein